MIKLIASDIDGTLLQNGERKISTELFELIERLHQNGILFAAASGRQYPNLRRLFAPVQEHMLFICENGALVMHHDEMLSCSEIPHPMGCELMRDILSYRDCEVLLSGRHTSYLQPKSTAYVDRMLYFTRNNVAVVEDLCAVNEPFLKISCYDPDGTAGRSAAYFEPRWSGRINCAIAGHEWFDFTLADKGTALAMLRERLGLQKQELLVFGDNFNDAPMFLEAGTAYAMEGAAAGVRALTKLHCGRVEDTIRELVEGLHSPVFR